MNLPTKRSVGGFLNRICGRLDDNTFQERTSIIMTISNHFKDIIIPLLIEYDYDAYNTAKTKKK